MGIFLKPIHNKIYLVHSYIFIELCNLKPEAHIT